MKQKLLERFSKYISFPTTSDDASESYPSTDTQLVFGDFLVEELKKIGMQDVKKDEYGYVTAMLPANTDQKSPVIGFIAHMDTAPDMPGVKAPRIIENYDGKDIMLDAETNTMLTVSDFPELEDYVGQTLLTTDGKGLLGADDKAGIAEIICAMEYLIQHPEIQHGELKVAFTPDEEIGKGVIHFDTPAFGCDFAYTMDGGAIGELEYENFNAASAVISIQGRNIHPGYAKDKMVNSQLIAMEFNALLPEFERPQYTQDYEGFYLLIKMEGSVENSTLTYIIRDHDRTKFEQKKQFIQTIVDFLNKKYGNRISCEIKDQYYNMREKVEPVYHVVTRAIEAMEKAGVTPVVVPIRGGTDGANLSFKGLPCPNIFAGGHNFHGKYEYVPLESMVKAVEVIVNISKS
ncbi:peptidase T [Bacteroidales bacterium OttesenSCG-928-C03]|nr:peptidase T [Bacteroidales bacterium OttesenSCG-928-C03]MDL2326868.1 peptidase T [Bacteroidales bacterium OttesenSCG-928-A14]